MNQITSWRSLVCVLALSLLPGYAAAQAVIFPALLGLLFSNSESERIILLPNKDGSSSAVTVKTAGGEQVLDKPYAGAQVSSEGKISSVQESAESVSARYGGVLSAQPRRQSSYLLYFKSNSVEIAPESQDVLKQLHADLKTRAAPEVSVIGHTDNVSSDAYNDALSLERAKAIRQILIADGVSANHLTVEGRGKREPLVPTAERVQELRNRRVEVTVR